MRLLGRSSLARCPARIAGIFVLALLAPGSLHAWKPDTQRAIALEAAALAPPDLARLHPEAPQGVSARHRRTARRRERRPSHEEPGRQRRARPGRRGRDERRDRSHSPPPAVRRGGGAPRSGFSLRHRRQPAAEHRELGRLRGAVFPRLPRLRRLRPAAIRGRFLRPGAGVDEPARPPDLDSRDTSPEAASSIPRSARSTAGSARSTERGLFDDRSTAFAVAALSYSHAVSDVARALRYVWLAAGGIDPRQRLTARRDALLVVDAGAGGAGSAGSAGSNDGR